jgi:hypothetical protein
MLSEQEIELAHPDAFDFAFGNLASDKTVWFDRHLKDCPYCQKVVSEYAEIGRIIQTLPPHVEPPPGLEDRTVTAVAEALASRRAEPSRQSGTEDQTATRIHALPQHPVPAEPETSTSARSSACLGGGSTEGASHPRSPWPPPSSSPPSSAFPSCNVVLRP